VRCARRLAGGVVWLLTWGIDSLKSGSAARAFKAQRTVEPEMAGIVHVALLFGLSHAPGLHFRGAVTMDGLGRHRPVW